MSVKNIVLTTAGLNAIHTASSNGVNVYINYFQPIYDHRLDPNVHTINANPQTDVSAFSACDSLATTITNIFGEKIYNGLTGYELSQYEALIVSATLGVDNASVDTVSYTTYAGESQSDTSRVNLYNGLPLSNILSATPSNNIVWDESENRFECPNTDGRFRLANPPAAPSNKFSKYFPVQSYTPITSGSGEVRGLYKCTLLSDVGNFKFNKVALYVSTLSANGSGWSLKADVDPVLFAVVYLTSPVYKAKTGLELTNYELDVELKITGSDTAISAISFYPGTDWARVPPQIENDITEVPSLHWDGYVGIRTYQNVNSNEKPQRPLHVTDPNQAQLRLGYNSSKYNDFRVNSISQLEYYGEAIIPGLGFNASLGIDSSVGAPGRWLNIYGNNINLLGGGGMTGAFYLKTQYVNSEHDLIFTEIGSDLNNGRFVNGDLIRRDTRGMMLVTEMPSTQASITYDTKGDSIMLIAGYAKSDWNSISVYDRHNSLFSKFFTDNGIEGMKLLNKGFQDGPQNTSDTQIRLFSPGNIRFTNMNGVFEFSRYFRADEIAQINPAISKWSITINQAGNSSGDLVIKRDFNELGNTASSNVNLFLGANIIPITGSIQTLGKIDSIFKELHCKYIYTNYISAQLTTDAINIYNSLLPTSNLINLGLSNADQNRFGSGSFLNVNTKSLSYGQNSEGLNIELFNTIVPNNNAVILGSSSKPFSSIYCELFPKGLRTDDTVDAKKIKFKVIEGPTTNTDITQVVLDIEIDKVVSFDVLIKVAQGASNSIWMHPEDSSFGNVFLYSAILVKLTSNSVNYVWLSPVAQNLRNSIYKVIVWYYE
jgi:hypothetical protein